MRKTNGNQTDDRERLSISDDDEICGTRIEYIRAFLNSTAFLKICTLRRKPYRTATEIAMPRFEDLG